MVSTEFYVNKETAKTRDRLLIFRQIVGDFFQINIIASLNGVSEEGPLGF
jgi:hypothetical protein